jgi:hypothetical protein
MDRDAQQILHRCDMQGRAVIVVTGTHIGSFTYQPHYPQQIAFRHRIK